MLSLYHGVYWVSYTTNVFYGIGNFSWIHFDVEPDNNDNNKNLIYKGVTF